MGNRRALKEAAGARRVVDGIPEGAGLLGCVRTAVPRRTRRTSKRERLENRRVHRPPSFMVARPARLTGSKIRAQNPNNEASGRYRKLGSAVSHPGVVHFGEKFSRPPSPYRTSLRQRKSSAAGKYGG